MSYSSSRKARIIRRRLRFGPTIARVFALSVLTVLAIIALASSTSNATKLYKQSGAVKKEAELKTEVDELKFWVNRLETLKNIKNENITNTMVPLDKVDNINSNSQNGEVAGVSTEKPTE